MNVASECKNCGEELVPFTRWKLCPSCRVAYGKGAAIMFVLGAIIELIKWLFGR